MICKPPRFDRAFTLIEMIGVLAIVACLAALLVPMIFEAVSSARIGEALGDLQTCKTAVASHAAKWPSLASDNGINLTVPVSMPYPSYDRVLVAEGFLDKPLASRLGTNATVQLVNISSLTADSSPDGSNGAYDLGGSGQNDVTGLYLVEAIIYGVSQADARALNNRLDGAALGEIGNSLHDLLGRVIYARPHAQGTLYDVHVYIAHQ